MKMLYDIIAGIISMIAKSLGVSYATANVAWSLYLQGLVCILSCLLLLIPMRKRYKQFGLDVFTISGTASILGYAYLIFANWFNFISPFIGQSFLTQHKALINYTKMTGDAMAHELPECLSHPLCLPGSGTNRNELYSACMVQPTSQEDQQ